MSRTAVLLQKYQDGEETAAEAEELALLVREDRGRATSLYDALMLEADLYDSYAGIAQMTPALRRRANWTSPSLLLIWSAAVFLFVAIAVLLMFGRTSAPPVIPAAPHLAPPKAQETPAPSEKKTEERRSERDEDDQEHRKGSREGDRKREEGKAGEAEEKRREIEREYQKGLGEVERKRAEGKIGEAEEKLLEIKRERDKQLRRLEQRSQDR